MRFIAFALTLFLLCIGARNARAENAHHHAFALIVTNNHSLELSRPDLHYADDDGVKYAELFRMITPEQDVYLLTELDRDTEALFPRMRGKTRVPTKAEVLAAAARIAKAASEAAGRGEDVDFYFVFAGHGDVEGGKGFLELRDARFTSDDMASLLKSIPSTRSHVILDSCNSFFVLNARKPGGRRAAIPEEAARSLRERLPNTGVFLSTSAEAEVFEWSDLQSGIFSHAVRSGLLGGADADHNGVISYDELAAFVHVASSKVKNPLYRPNVFARGPHGRGDGPIFVVSEARGASLEIDASPRTRLTIRDAEDIPWIDVNKEEGSPVELHLPAHLAERASVEERETTEQGSRVVRRVPFMSAPVDPPLRLADATAALPRSEPRGPNDALRMLFAAPFGPRAMAVFQTARERDDEPVIGVSREDAERMRLMLAQVSGLQKSERLLEGVGFLSMGAFTLGAGIGFRVGFPQNTGVRVGSYVLMGAGALTMGFSALKFATRSPAEKLYEDFNQGMSIAGPLDSAKLVARTEQRLHQLAAEYRSRRRVALYFNAITATVAGTWFVVAAAVPSAAPFGRGPTLVTFGTTFLLSTFSAVNSSFPTPIERMVDLWNTDPSLTRLPRLSISPLTGGALLGLSGQL